MVAVFKRALLLFIKILPYRLRLIWFNREKKKKTKLFGILETVYYQTFFKQSPLVKNYKKSIKRVKKRNKYCLITHVIWEHSFINVCFITEVLSLIVWCLENGYKPLIDIKNKSKDNNLWEEMFLQPFNDNLEAIKASGNYIVCPFESNLWISMQDARDDKKSNLWNKLINDFVVFNSKCYDYINNEYEDLIEGKKVLGCLIRGTEYLTLRPKNHPIQPTLEEFIKKIEEIKNKENLDYIYFASEDYEYARKMREKFGSALIENKRTYRVVQNNVVRKVSINKNSDNDTEFNQALEYISSMCLLSKCNSFVAGLCGGSELAVFYNGGRFNTCYLFDKGVYEGSPEWNSRERT